MLVASSNTLGTERLTSKSLILQPEFRSLQVSVDFQHPWPNNGAVEILALIDTVAEANQQPAENASKAEDHKWEYIFPCQSIARSWVSRCQSRLIPPGIIIRISTSVQLLLIQICASLLVGSRSITVNPLPSPILLQGILFSSMVLLASIVEGASLRQLVETTPILQFSLSNVSKVYSKLCLFSQISYSAAFPLGTCRIDDSLLLSKVLNASLYYAKGFQ